MKVLVSIVSVFCVGLIALAVFLTNQKTVLGPRLIPMNQSYQARLDQGGWVKGDPSAKIEILELADYQCSGCAGVAPMLSEVQSSRPDAIKLRYRNYPLEMSHNKARLSAQAAEAAGRQGKFWEMHDMLFANQKNWNDLTSGAFRNELITYAKALQLHEEQFLRDLDDDSIDDVINKDIEAGNNLRIEATPSVFINGQQVKSIPTDKDAFLKLIDEMTKIQ